MVTVTLQLDENVAERLQQLAESQQRTPEDLVVEGVVLLTSRAARPMPKGVGQRRERFQGVQFHV